MGGRWPFTAEKIAARLALVEPYIFRRSLVLANFRLLPLQGAVVDAPICADPTHWEEIPHQSYWGHADLNFVLKSHFTVPEGWNADRLALHLPLGVFGDIFNHPEALVHIDRVPIGSSDRYHHTLALGPSVADGRPHVLSLHGWTGLSGWPPDPASKAKLFMGAPKLVERDEGLLAFTRLARTTLDTVKVLDPTSDIHIRLLEALDDAFRVLDTRDPIGNALYDSVDEAQRVLKDRIAAAGAPLDVTLHAIGHAHMDIAYLWPISQIRLKNARTYSNVLRLMNSDPAYCFSHSQPQLYAMTAEDYPALFEQIKARVTEGRWEVMGGMWVEPDLNIPGPEALVQQLRLGRSYFRQTFGDVETPVLWLPDTFGFPAQIPQLMRHAGLKWFATNKLNWNQLNPVASSSHIWEGLDGSQVLAHVLTTPRDVQYLPFPTNYKSDLSAAEVMGTWTRSTAQDSVRDLPICYGYGDGGGGPTEDLLEKAHAFDAMPGMPRLRMGTVRAAFEAIEQSADQLPTHRGEHYLEGHRGVYTSQGWIKRANRKAEWALHEAEALCAMAGQAADLDEAWQLLCLNQFHDIITGTSVAEVFQDARRDFARIIQLAEAAAETASKDLACNSASIANTSPVSGPRLLTVKDAPPGIGQTVDEGTVLFFEDLPAYSVTPLQAATMPPHRAEGYANGAIVVLENALVRVTIGRDGQLHSVLDKATDRQVLAHGAFGNHLLAFEDRPISWDAWDIDPSFEDRVETVSGTSQTELIETGPLRAAVRVTTKWRSSTIVQTIRLAAHSARIDFETKVDWHESHTLLKAAFPTAISARTAQFDIQWGMVERATSRDTPFDAARFEVPAQKWAQLAEPGYAVALLNDCKYGYDVLDGTLRITLIKSSTSPDPGADQGHHAFTYSLLPIPDADRALLDREAYDLNAPMRVLRGANLGATTTPPFLSCQPKNVIAETLRPSEDANAVIVRVFEAHGLSSKASLCFRTAPKEVAEVDFLEKVICPMDVVGAGVSFELQPFEIRSLRVRF